MNIVKEPIPTQYEARIPEYCCKTYEHFKDWFNVTLSGIFLRSPYPKHEEYGRSGHPGFSYTSKIDYCPFCGEKIESFSPHVGKR